MEVLNGTESFLWVRVSSPHHPSVDFPFDSGISEVLAWHMARVRVLILRAVILHSRSIGYVLSARA